MEPLDISGTTWELHSGKMANPSVIRDPVAQNVVTELHSFLAGASHKIPVEPQELAKSALFLLKNVPAGKEAVLEYLCSIFDRSVRHYVISLKDEGSSAVESYPHQEDIVIGEIHTALSNFISSNPEAWAPIISTWSLELLGTLSSRYAKEAAAIPHNAGLNEMLQMWVSCRATRTLIDITTHCFSCLVHSKTNDCVSALLDTSVKHSPHFDWVVAHIGGCFPNMVITRVLDCGLCDFYQYSVKELHERETDQAPKLKSVVGILSYLAGSHFGDIKQALLHLFITSMDDHPPMEAEATVPFLLQISSMSGVLCHALMASVLPALTPKRVVSVSEKVAMWTSERYLGSQKSLVLLVVHLILRSEEGKAHAVELLMGMAAPEAPVPTEVRETAQQLMEHLLQEMSHLVHSSSQQLPSEDIPLLCSLGHSCREALQSSLLGSDPFRAHCAARLVSLLALHQGPDILASTLAHLLAHAPSPQEDREAAEEVGGEEEEEEEEEEKVMDRRGMDEGGMEERGMDERGMEEGGMDEGEEGELMEEGELEEEELEGDRKRVMIDGGVLLEAVTRLLSGTESTYPNALADGVAQVLQDCKSSASRLTWRNLVCLLDWEKSSGESRPIHSSTAKALRQNLGIVSDHLLENKDGVSHLAAKAMCLVLDPHTVQRLPVSQLTKICHRAVAYFFHSLGEKNCLRQSRGSRQACEILEHVSLQSHGKAAVLRLLLEGVMSPYWASLFGGRSDDVQPPESHPPTLFALNQLQGTASSSAFHAGVVGQGLRMAKGVSKKNSKKVLAATQRLLEAINACCAVGARAAKDSGQQGAKRFPSPSSSKETSPRPQSPVPVTSPLLDGMSMVSLLLVELISPDVMFNGLPWPEEEFTKVTVERDLKICKRFEENPVLWHLLRLVASNCPSLCYCSVLLRALTATLLFHWSACQEEKARDSPRHLDTTLRLLDIMALGRLLPVPLAYVGEILSFLAPHEVACILHDIWNYMRDNVPAPTLFSKDAFGQVWRDLSAVPLDKQYVERLRLIFLNNMGLLGRFYSHFFPTQT